MANVIEFSVKANDEFSGALNKLQGGLTKTETAFAALGVTAAIYGAIRLVKASLDNAEAMGVAALKANMTTESYSALAFAASQSNVEAGSLAAGMRGLNKAMAEGNMSAAGLALANVGVAARDANGELRPTIDVLYDVADAFAASKDDANKTKVAMEIFSKAGKDMVPLLNMGGEAIRGMMVDAEKLGLVISGDFAKAADQINDDMAVMAAVIGGSVNVAMAELAPTIQLLTGELVSFLKEGDAVKDTGAAIAVVMKSLLSIGTVVAGMFSALGKIIGATFAAIIQATTGDFSGAVETIKNVSKDLVEDSKKTGDKVKSYWDGSAQAAAKTANASASAALKLKASMAVIGKAQEDARKEAEKLEKSIKDLEISMKAQIKTVGMTADQTKIYELKLKGASDAQVANLKSLAKTIEGQIGLKKALDGTKGAIEGQRTELEVYNDTMADWQARLDHGLITQAEFTLATERQTKAWDKSKVSTQAYKDGVTNAFREAGVQIRAHIESLGSVAYQIGTMMANTFETLIVGVSDSVAQSIVMGKDLSDSLSNLYNQVASAMISTLIQIGIRRALVSAGVIAAYEVEAAAGAASAASQNASAWSVGGVWVAVGAFIVLVIWQIAKNWTAFQFLFKEIWMGIRETLEKAFNNPFKPIEDTLESIVNFIKEIINAAAKLHDSLADFGGGGGLGQIDPIGGAIIGGIGGMFHGGMTDVPAEASYLLQKGERVLSPNQNRDLTNFIEGSGGGGSVVIQNLTVHVLENATNTDAFARMDKIQLRAALGQPVVDALNEMYSLGVRPNFAAQG